MTAPTQGMPYSPAPVEVVAFIGRILGHEWPHSEAERVRVFEALGMHSPQRPAEDAEENIGGIWVLKVPLGADVDARWSSFRGSLVLITLFLYPQPSEQHPQVREKFAELRTELSTYFSPPTETWGTEAMPAARWTIGTCGVELYCFNKPNSVLMLCIEDLQLARLAEAAAVADSAP
ncbi:hypothetical protein AFL94_12325 [Arthrobacter sp. LS16]|nr:hypothetical protein AFL94_12325 [Arthrobacter sp. LS16]